MGRLIGYGRATRDEDPRPQVRDLLDAGCDEVFVERGAGALDDRPELDRALRSLGPGDTLTVRRLSRLGRSVRHLRDTVAEVRHRGAEFWSIEEGVDTRAPGGELAFQVIGALAGFERDLAHDRTDPGRTAARSRGRMGGRPPSMTPEKVRIARDMYESRRYTVAAIAREVGVSRASVYRHLAPARS